MSEASTGRRFSIVTGVFAGVALLGLGWWLIWLASHAALAWLGMLVAFAYATPLAAGLVVWPAIVQISNGSWEGDSERIAASGLAFAPVSLAVLGLLWLGSGHWAPWASSSPPQGAWLSGPFLFSRDLAGLALFWVTAWLHRHRRLRGGGRKAAVLVILAYGAVFSLLGFDLVMALDPAWRSEMFGGYFFISGLYGAVAAWALAAALGDADPGRLQDFGKLLVAFCMLTTYLMYSQLLPIWYENIPKETRFLVPVMNLPGWKAISLGLLAVVYLGPIGLLLTIWSKRNRFFLAGVSMLVLAGLWVERWWLVAPRFEPSPVLHGSEVAATMALAGLLGLGMAVLTPRLPRLPGSRP